MVQIVMLPVRSRVREELWMKMMQPRCVRVILARGQVRRELKIVVWGSVHAILVAIAVLV